MKIETSRQLEHRTVGRETEIPIRVDSDIVVARQHGRQLAAELGFNPTDLTLIATVISELARNIVCYAKHGEITVASASKSAETGITITARDDGPGIWDIERAVQAGYSTSGGLGLGLPGVKRLMDEFHIESRVGKGTLVRATKWKR